MILISKDRIGPTMQKLHSTWTSRTRMERSYVTTVAVLFALLCFANSTSHGQKLDDVSAYMGMPIGSYFVDTTGYTSIEQMSVSEIAERSWAKLGFHAAIPTIYDPAPSLKDYKSELPRDSMQVTNDAGRFLYDTMYIKFGNYTWIFHDRDNRTNYSTYDLRFDDLVRCIEYNDFLYDLKYAMMGSAEFYSRPLVGVLNISVPSQEARQWIEMRETDVLSFSSVKAINSRLYLYGVDGSVASAVDVQQDGVQKYSSVQTIDCAKGIYFLCGDRSLIATVCVR